MTGHKQGPAGVCDTDGPNDWGILMRRLPNVVAWALGLIVPLASFAATPALADDAGGHAAWVEMAPDGGSIVRALTSDAGCPALTIDGHARMMAERAAPAILPERTNKAGVAGGTDFTTRVCEMALPRDVRRASLGGRALPLPRARIDRIVLIGDTGCRLKDADKAWQACNDPVQWPFAAIAARAAALHPDMVLHVGDYLYRENACPTGQSECAGTVTGYGEAGWQADFLAPAAPLLAAAPWVMVRGNHEECARAGQGWWRLFDPHGLVRARDCLDPANDVGGNHTAPYAVDLGGNARLVVLDLVGLTNAKDDASAAIYRDDLARMGQLARGARTSFATAHYPFNAVEWDKHNPGSVMVGGKPVSALAPFSTDGVRAMIAGHVHFFQFAQYADRPRQVVTGFSGTMEDTPPSPANLAEVAGKPGGDALRALTTIAGRFGYALMERGPHGWRLTAYGVDGAVIGRFAL
jgi:hypothetical protein